MCSTVGEIRRVFRSVYADLPTCDATGAPIWYTSASGWVSKDGLVRTVSTETMYVLLGVAHFDVEVIRAKVSFLAMTGLPSDWAVDDVHRISIHDLKSRLREILSCR